MVLAPALNAWSPAINSPFMLRVLVVCCALPAFAAAPIAVSVDLTQAPRRLISSELTLSVTPGPLTLVYPKWLPGEHAPTGPVTDLTVSFLAAGKPLAWHRDPEDLFAFSLEVPAGVAELKARLTVLSPPPGNSDAANGATTSANLAMLNWNQVVLAPKGAAATSLSYRPQLKLPAGWKWASALSGVGQGSITFAPVSLETLVDSPVLAGAHLEVSPLGAIDGANVGIAVAAETGPEARLSAEDLATLVRLVDEEGALYGARHFERYTFLLIASDEVPSNGVEHHQSSDDRLPGQVLVDEDLSHARLVPLLAHEMTHSWNGKFRRPQGLATPDYQQAIHSELLWVYEGLTQYLGHLLTTRSRAWDVATARDNLALLAQRLRNHRGRSWRTLEDTATSAQLLYGARKDWAGLRREVDFYEEGELLWLEVDLTLREKSGGTRCIDDFVHAFHGGPSTGAQVKPYTLDEVVTTLEALVPFDWKTLLLTRVQSFTTDAPMEGLTRAGWKLGFTSKQPELLKVDEKEDKQLDLTASIGVLVDTEKLALVDVMPGSAADQAGLAPAMKLVAVNARKVTPERLTAAVEQTRKGGALVLLVENAETFSSFTLSYKDGLRYPTLERLPGVPDGLEQVYAPRAAH